MELPQDIAQEMNTRCQGIDIHQALNILSLRSQQPQQQHDHHDDHPLDTSPATSHDCSDQDNSTHKPSGCHQHIPKGGISMGQHIDLTQTEEEAKALVESMELQRQTLEKERQERLLEIKSKLKTMTVKELLGVLTDAQAGRVGTYREYNESLEVLLRTGNMSPYPAACAKATALFSVQSETINTIQRLFNGSIHNRKDLEMVIAGLQNHEREKLNLTAALHLEKIRSHNQRLQTKQDDDEPIIQLLQDGIATIQQRLAICVQGINDALEEIRFAIAEEEDC